MKTGIHFIGLFFLVLTSFGQQHNFSSINFSKPDSIAKIYKGHSLKNLHLLSNKLTKPFSNDVEKFRAIYTWVSNNISSDITFNEKIIRKHKKYKNDSIAFTKWNNNYNEKFFKRMLEQKTTICTGYAYLIKELANFANIESNIIHGSFKHSDTPFPDVKLPNHSWNAVKLNNEWYLCDATLSSGYYSHDLLAFIHDYNDGYFLAPPSAYIKSHYPIYKNWTLLKQRPTFEQFVNGPIVYENAFEYGITPISPKTIAMEILKNEAIQFQFQFFKKIDFKKTPLKIFYQSINKIIEPPFTIHGDTITMNHAFENSGTYDIHFKIKNKPIVTYSIKVHKK